MEVREEITTQHPARRRFGEYEVQRDGRGKLCMLGTGSYGRTYRARHALLGTFEGPHAIGDPLAIG